MSNQINHARDSFLENLHAMATGSYLRDEDKEFWDAPYPESVVEQVRAIIDSLILATSNISKVNPADLKAAAASSGISTEGDEDSPAPSLETMATIAAVTPAVEELLKLSSQHDGAVMEDEEVEDFQALVRALAAQAGADSNAVAEHVGEMIESQEL